MRGCLPHPTDLQVGLAAVATSAVAALIAAIGQNLPPGVGPLAPAIGAVLYTRMSATPATAQATRERILEHVRAQPGATPADLARALGAHRTTVRYHLRVLVRDRLLVERGTRGQVHFFTPTDRDAAARLEASVALQSPPARAIVHAVQARPGIGVREAGVVAGIHRITAHYHVRHLAAAGVLRVERDGNALRLFLAGESAPSSA